MYTSIVRSPWVQFLALFLPLMAFGNPMFPGELITKSTNHGNSTTSRTMTTSRNSSRSSLRLLADQTPESPKSDTLGITRCYCASPTWDRDNVFGHYYLWDYYNFHSNHRFLVERFCHSGEMTRSGILGSADYQIMCLRPREDHHECETDQHGNKFCYILNGKEAKDRFKYNHQMRGLPVDSSGEKHESEGHVEEACGKFCHDKVRGLEMLKGRALVHANHVTPEQDKFNAADNEWSHISFYPEIDDMCPKCV